MKANLRMRKRRMKIHEGGDKGERGADGWGERDRDKWRDVKAKYYERKMVVLSLKLLYILWFVELLLLNSIPVLSVVC